MGRVFQKRSCCCCSWRRLDYARLLLVAASIASSLGHGLRIRIPDSGYRTAGKVVDEGGGGVAWWRLRSHQYATCELQMYNMITCKSRDCDWDYCTHTHTAIFTILLAPYSFLATAPLVVFFYCLIFFFFRFEQLPNKLKNSYDFDISFFPFLISFPFHLPCYAFRYSSFVVLYSHVFS